MRLVLRANAVAYLVAGLFLGFSTWDWLYTTLGTHKPNPAPFAQLAGVLFCALAYLLWIAPRESKMSRAVAAAVAFANAATAALLVVWELPDRAVLTTEDRVTMTAGAIVCAAFAVVEVVVASRSVAVLLPAD